ncbi:hypothetical protein R3I94_014081 [Phoxinus phoxinus]|uniref:Uncharacterized protein n=1 Tax=Phoxinus phoxinus TaxID=58324 RepID=A0AAN9CR93_9TELE
MSLMAGHNERVTGSKIIRAAKPASLGQTRLFILALIQSRTVNSHAETMTRRGGVVVRQIDPKKQIDSLVNVHKVLD